MAFITFYYSLGRRSNEYFLGKYVTDYFSDDHLGLDREVRSALVEGLNAFRAQKGLKKIKSKNLNIAVIGFSGNECRVPSYSSKRERKAFDFYYEEDDCGRKKMTFVNGKKIAIAGHVDCESDSDSSSSEEENPTINFLHNP